MQSHITSGANNKCLHVWHKVAWVNVKVTYFLLCIIKLNVLQFSIRQSNNNTSGPNSYMEDS